jgi:hypothetical protein
MLEIWLSPWGVCVIAVSLVAYFAAIRCSAVRGHWLASMSDVHWLARDRRARAVSFAFLSFGLCWSIAMPAARDTAINHSDMLIRLAFAGCSGGILGFAIAVFAGRLLIYPLAGGTVAGLGAAWATDSSLTLGMFSGYMLAAVAVTLVCYVAAMIQTYREHQEFERGRAMTTFRAASTMPKRDAATAEAVVEQIRPSAVILKFRRPEAGSLPAK